MNKYTNRICDIKEELLLITNPESIEITEILLKNLDIAIRIHEAVLAAERIKNCNLDTTKKTP